MRKGWRMSFVYEARIRSMEHEAGVYFDSRIIALYVNVWTRGAEKLTSLFVSF